MDLRLPDDSVPFWLKHIHNLMSISGVGKLFLFFFFLIYVLPKRAPNCFLKGQLVYILDLGHTVSVTAIQL